MARRTPRAAAPLLAGAALLLGAPSALAATTPVTAMTRNVFLGGDLPPIAAAPPGAPFRTAAGNLLAEVRRGEPNARMRLIAGEIARARPDLVGLQEVSLYRTGPEGDPRPARHVLFDFLGVIRRELARRGAHYRVVADRRSLDIEGPTDRGVDIRLTLGDVTLARRGVRVTRSRTGVFAHQLTIPSRQLGDISPGRSWNAVDVTVRGARAHVVNTHLEAYSPDVRLAQARELVRGPLRSGRTTILLGDLNSGPALPSAADRPPYLTIARAGFAPRRTRRPSCCFDDLTGAGGWDHNVDWIMTRGSARLVRSFLTGRERTRGGLVPSDHGGVVSVLRVRRAAPAGPRLTG